MKFSKCCNVTVTDSETGDTCRKCQQPAETEEHPTCYGRFDKKSEFCQKVCKHGNDCIKISL